HPGELVAVLASGEQSVPISADAEACPFIVASKNRFDRRLQFLGVTIVGDGWVFLCCEKIIVDRNDVPKRGVDRIEFRLLALIGKAIRQHALRNNAGPLEQNIARIFEPAGGDAEAAKRNERVASPVAEPWIACDEGFSFAALDKICVTGAFE